MSVVQALRVIVVDDESIARQRLCRLLSLEPNVAVIAECADGREAVNVLRTHPADLVFLDVQMPEMDGFAVLREVPAEKLPLVVFVTAYDSYAIRAFEASAIDYLLKPFRRERFQQTLHRVREQVALRAADGLRLRVSELAHAQKDQQLAIRSGAVTLLLRNAEIDWIEAAGNYACLHCGGETHIVRETLASLERRLNPSQFIRIHRSTIVNAARIREIAPYGNGDRRLVLLNGAEIRLSRTYAGKLPLLTGGR